MPTVAEIVLKYRDQFSEQAKRDLLAFERQTKSTMSQAKDSADVLKDTLGIQLPRELTKLIAQSKILGPALAASFNVVAIFGFIAAAQQIPALFEKLTSAITGWDEASKKAFENFLDNNKKAFDSTEKFRLKLIEIREGQAKASEEAIRAKQAEVDQLSRAAAAPGRPLGFLDFAAGNATFGLYDPRRAEKNDRLALQQRAQAAGAELLTLQRGAAVFTAEEEKKAAIADANEAKKRADELAKALAAVNLEFARLIARQQEGIRTGFFSGGVHDPARNEALRVIEEGESFAAARAAADSLSGLRPTMGLSFFNPDVFDPAVADVNRSLRTQAVLQEATEEFVRSFRDGAGQVWDAFTTRGQSALTSLANMARALLSTIGRSIFQNFATGLLTGGRSAGGGVASLAGNFGASLGLGGLFGGGSAAVIPSVAPGVLSAGALAGIPGIGTGGLVGIGGGAASGGLAGTLGLSGGAGLFGLGAATIPVIGAVALGAFLGLKAIFGHKTIEAPFTRDPNEAERSRSIFFFTGMTEALDRFSRAVDRFDTMPPGQVVKDGLPAALSSSNQFRRVAAGVLMDDDL